MTLLSHLPLLSALAFAWALYLTGARALWRRAGGGRGVGRAQVACFGAGLATVAAALVVLDGVAHERFSAHMIQHLLLVLVAAPLIALARPLLPLLWALPPDARRRVGPAVAAGRRVAGAPAWPLVALVLHAGAMWAWHAPALYDAALASPAVHVVEHATMLGTALLFWSTVVASGAHGRLGHATAVLVVFATALQSGGLGALLTLAPQPLYVHADVADQQLAGLLMWVPGGLLYAAAGAVVLALGLRHVERRALRRELGSRA